MAWRLCRQGGGSGLAGTQARGTCPLTWRGTRLGLPPRHARRGILPLSHVHTSKRSHNSCTLQVNDILSGVVMPACSLVPTNVALVAELWAVLQRFSYPQRFTLYASLQVGRLTLGEARGEGSISERDLVVGRPQGVQGSRRLLSAKAVVWKRSIHGSHVPDPRPTPLDSCRS